MTASELHDASGDARRAVPRRSLAWQRLGVLAALCCLTVALDGCFLKKYVYRPVLVANAIGDSTTTLAATKVHVYRTDEYEIYGPSTASVATAERQVDRAYREFAKHFGVQAPPMVIVVADSEFVISPSEVGSFAKRRIHTFVYVRPRNLRDIEGVEHHQHVQQARDDQKGIAVFVGERDDAPGAGARTSRDEEQDADAHIGQGGKRDQRLADLQRKEPALEPEAAQKHESQGDEKRDAFLNSPEKEMAGARDRPRGQADQICVNGRLLAIGRRGTHPP